MSKIVLSIVVAIYKSEKYVQQLLNTFLPIKNNEKIEIIFICDGMTDNSLKKIQSSFKNFTRTKTLSKKKGKNLASESRNLGAKMASGEWLWFFDHDDELININKLFYLIDLLPNINQDIIHFNYKITKYYDKYKKYMNSNLLKNKITSDFVYSKTCHKHIRFDHAPWSRIYKKKIFPKNKWPLIYPEDLLFNTKLLDDGYDIYFYNEYLYQWNLQKTSSSLKNRQKLSSVLHNVLNNYEDYEDYEDYLLGIFIFASTSFHRLSKNDKAIYKKLYKKFKYSKIYNWYYKAQGFKGYVYLILSMSRAWILISYIQKRKLNISNKNNN